MIHFIEENSNVTDFITPIKLWDTKSLINILPKHIINNIKAIPIPIFDLKDRIAWKFTSHYNFSIKIATWTDNTRTLYIRKHIF